MTTWSMTVRRAGVLLAVAGCFFCGQLRWNATALPSIQFPRPPAGFGDHDASHSDQPDPAEAEKRLRALNADRHKALVSDTEKLVKLARQLDAEIASNPTNDLTLEEMRKVATIEKLAHSVKTKMAQTFGGGPEFKPPILPIGIPREQ